MTKERYEITLCSSCGLEPVEAIEHRLPKLKLLIDVQIMDSTTFPKEQYVLCGAFPQVEYHWSGKSWTFQNKF